MRKPQSIEPWPSHTVHLRKDAIIQVSVPGPNLYDKKEGGKKKRKKRGI